MKITLFGLAGTGTSSAGKRLAKVLGLPYRSGGDFMRKVASDMGMDFLEFVRKCAEDPSYDKKVDQAMREFADSTNDFVIEGRLAWYFVPDSLKIMLVCDEEVRLQRVAGRDNVSADDAKNHVKEREVLDIVRYEQYYGIKDFGAKHYFDEIVDTTIPNLDEVVEILRKIVVEKSGGGQ